MLKIIVLNILLSLQNAPVTMTSIEQKPGSDSINVTIRYNYNLFLRDYQQTINDDVDLEKLQSYSPFPADMANNYINSKLIISLNKKVLLGKLVKMEVSDRNDVILALLYRVDRKAKSLTIRNIILNGLFSNVENLAIIRIGDIERQVKFTQQHTVETYSLK